MTNEEFLEGFRKLVEAFNVTNPEKKARIYFEELKSIKAPMFMETVRRIIRQTDKFPPISTILSIAGGMVGQEGDRRSGGKCERCDGYGFVMFENYAFRGRCEHGKILSEKMAWAPETEIDKANWRNRLRLEQEKVYGKLN